MPPNLPQKGDDSRKNWPYIARHSALLDALNVRLRALEIKDDPIHKRRSSGGGWRFAEPKEYDWITGIYDKDLVVIVSPDSPAVTAGVNQEATESHGILTGKDGTPHEGELESEDVAMPGTWVCLRNPKVLSAEQPDPEEPRNYDIHVPTWPPPNDDPDSEENYWWPVSFYPTEAIFCNTNTGDDGTYYIHAALKPEPEEEA